jgi:hypothetical protein
LDDIILFGDGMELISRNLQFTLTMPLLGMNKQPEASMPFTVQALDSGLDRLGFELEPNSFVHKY